MFIVGRYFHLDCFCSKRSIGRPAEEFKLVAFFCHPNPLESAILPAVRKREEGGDLLPKKLRRQILFLRKVLSPPLLKRPLGSPGNACKQS